MRTVTMNISMSESLKAFVDTRVSEGGYSSVSEYMRELVRRDEEKAAEGRFVALIQEGLNSPKSPLTPQEHIAQLRERIAADTQPVRRRA